MAFREEKPWHSDGPVLLGKDEIRTLAQQVPEWTVHEKSMERRWTFADFRAAMAFVNRVADVAESLGHHPDIYISYNTVRLELSTHKVGGLTPQDFQLAEKIDALHM